MKSSLYVGLTYLPVMLFQSFYELEVEERAQLVLFLPPD